jgi:uncharacterized membrane protein YfcA
VTVSRRAAVVAGLAGGAAGALLGGGTGVVTVPVLDRLTTLRRGTIHGTANLVNVAVAVVALTLAIGVVVGAWSAAMGLGGGALTVPILILCFGVCGHGAEGTSLLVMLPNSVVASVQHLRQGTASARLGATVAFGAAPGAVAGAFLGLALGGTVLDWVFGVFVLFVAAREASRMLRG